MSTRERVEIFDTTLRDGLQVEGVSATVEDKLRIAEQLDRLGVAYIEGGWPGANPKDIEFFRRATTELHLPTSTLVAFGSTRRPKGKVDDDPTLRNLIEAEHRGRLHRRQELGLPRPRRAQHHARRGRGDGRRLASSSCVGHGRRVMVDAEHFFDGYKRNPEFAMRALEAAAVKGASHLVLCDTNGGSLPHEVEEIVGAVKAHFRDDVDHRHPLPRRHRLRGGQRHGRGAGRGPPGAGEHERPRRADRQHATSRP